MSLFTEKKRVKHTKKRSRSPLAQDTTSSDENDTTPKKSKGKLISGKLTRSDEVGIKVQVRYAHSKLNREFTPAVAFDKLPLHLLAAGELELIQETTCEIERSDRTRILTLLMYYVPLLDIADLRDQYDIIMKKVERKELRWGDNLPDRIDRALDRRLRLKDWQDKRKHTVDSSQQQTEKVQHKEEFIYCNAFNRGTCTEEATHRGRFGGREGVLLNHACSKCLYEKGICVGHAAVDDRCPFSSKSGDKMVNINI